MAAYNVCFFFYNICNFPSVFVFGDSGLVSISTLHLCSVCRWIHFLYARERFCHALQSSSLYFSILLHSFCHVLHDFSLDPRLPRCVVRTRSEYSPHLSIGGADHKSLDSNVAFKVLCRMSKWHRTLPLFILFKWGTLMRPMRGFHWLRYCGSQLFLGNYKFNGLLHLVSGFRMITLLDLFHIRKTFPVYRC